MSRINRRDFIKVSAGALTVAMLSACGATPTPTKVPPTATKAAAAAPAATAVPAAAAGPLPKVNLWSNMIALTKPEGSDPERLDEVKKYIMDKVGVEPVGFVPPTDATAAAEKLNLTLGAKDQELDIFSGDWGQYKDAIQPINDLLDKYGANVVKAHTKENWAAMKDKDGKIWGIPRLGVMGHTEFVFVRQDWAKEFGMKTPVTLEELEAYLVAMKKKDPASLIATDSREHLAGATCAGFTEFGYARWLDPKDNKVKPPELQAGFKDWVAKMADWWQKGYFLKETFTPQQWPDVFKSNKIGAFMGWYSVITIQVPKVADAVPGMYYDFCYNLKGPKGWMKTNRLGGSTAIMITKKSKNPDAVMKLVNWEYDPGKDNLMTVVYGIKGKDWDWVDPNNKYYVKRLILPSTPGARVYAGEFMAATGLGTDPWTAPDDPLLKRHYETIRDYALKYDLGKMPFDYDIAYDSGALRKAVPGWADITRMIEEETIKFITGTRPLTEWDAFIKQLDAAGMQDYINAYTTQYMTMKGKA